MPNPTPHPKGPAPRTPEKLTGEEQFFERLIPLLTNRDALVRRQAFEEAARQVWARLIEHCDQILSPDLCREITAAIRALAKEKPYA